MSEESLFELAVNTPEAGRAALLDRECGGDAALRGRIEALLAAHFASGSPLDAAPNAADGTRTFGSADRTASHQPATETAGVVVAGRYKLLQQIGEGGMGTVWMADQTEPVKRRVAVKLIRTERGQSKTILSRFDAERQAIALMDHPHIAKLLDAGTTETGSPFFVMELVKGVPLNEFCDTHKLSIPDRLHLFMQICSAVQHAHQKGVIHRDIKPSNILVESHDGKPLPKVIDFGLAKATTGLQLTEHTLFTGFGSVMGTPLYMAPEQATFNAVDVDTRADVYALGVILYELLTGTTPLTRDTMKKAALDELLKLVREQEAPTPSSRLSSAGSSPSVAANRQTEPAKLGRFVKGELDWIVLKALSKERDRRYETANGFAKDIERFLNHEPVTAGPVTAGYRLKKLVQRNKGRVVAASVVLLALVAGTAGTTFGLIRAENRRAEAEQSKEREADQRAKAEASEARALAAAAAERTAAGREAERANAEVKERQRADGEKERALRYLGLAVDTLLAATGPDVEKLIGSRTDLTATERGYLEAVAKRWQDFAAQLGSTSETHLYRAEGQSRVAKLWVKLGRPDEARAAYESAREAYAALARLAPGVAETWQRLAAARNDLGIVLADLGRRKEAWAELVAARDLRAKLVAQYPAVQVFQAELSATRMNLGIHFAEAGRTSEAQTEFGAALELLVPLAAKFPDDEMYQRNVVRSRLNLGLLLDLQGAGEAARVELTAALDLHEAVAQRFPDAVKDPEERAAVHSALGAALQRLSRPAEARRAFETARDIQIKLTEQFPAVPRYRARLADTSNKLGLLLFALGQRDAAAAEHTRAREQREKLVEQFPTAPQYRVDLGGSYCNYGQELFNAGKSAESLEWFDKAVRTLRSVYDPDPQNAQAKEFLRNSHQNRALAYDALGRSADALRDWDLAVDLSPPEERNNFRLGRIAARYRTGMVAEAADDVGEIAKSETLSAAHWYTFARVCATASAKSPDKKQEYADRAMEILRKAVKAGYTDAAQLQTDPNLTPLRGRGDFQQLVASLQPKEVAPPPRAKP